MVGRPLLNVDKTAISQALLPTFCLSVRLNVGPLPDAGFAWDCYLASRESRPSRLKDV